jgi:hypothetical protein
LREENQRRRQEKEQKRRQIAHGGSLTVAEGLDRIRQLDGLAVGPSNGPATELSTAAATELATTAANLASTTGQKRRRAPPKCSVCGTVGHTARVTVGHTARVCKGR